MSVPSKLGPHPLNLEALKANPPSARALNDAFAFLARCFLPAKFPALSFMDHEDIANETLCWAMRRIETIEVPQQIVMHAHFGGMTLVRRRNPRNRVSLINLDDLWSLCEDPSLTLWQMETTAAASKQRRLEVIYAAILALPRKRRMLVSAYLKFLRSQPKGTRREFAHSIGRTETYVNVTFKRLRDMLVKIKN